MFKKEVPKYRLMLEDEIEHTLKTLRSHVTGSDDYVKTLATVERLHKMLEEESDSVSKDTWANVGANLLGILMILKHESVGNFISSKALGFVHRIRI